MQNNKLKPLNFHIFWLIPLTFLLANCAVLHHAQVGSIDNRDSQVQVPFEVLLSEVGVSTEEIGRIGRAANKNNGDSVADAAAILALFQMGPRTGNLTYNPRYAEKLIYEIHQRCPSGNVTGLMSIREMRKYPAISGEIVKVTGYCRKDRKPASEMNEGDL